MRYRCFLFDHDDTLLPTFDLRARVLGDAARTVMGKTIDGADALARSHGRNLEQMSTDLAGGDPALGARLVAAYRERYYQANRHGLAPYAGVTDTLSALRERGARIAVVTSKLGSGARDELERTGLAPFIEHLVGAEDVRDPKPAPEPLERALAALGARAADALMVGDTHADMLGARAAGTASAAALWGARDDAALLALAPDHVLRHPRELLQLVA